MPDLTNPPVPATLLDVEACGHCWHQFGPASGGIGTNGTTMRGTNRCCHCGKLQTYDIVIPPSPPITHGPLLLTINGEPK